MGTYRSAMNNLSGMNSINFECDRLLVKNEVYFCKQCHGNTRYVTVNVANVILSFHGASIINQNRNKHITILSSY